MPGRLVLGALIMLLSANEASAALVTAFHSMQVTDDAVDFRSLPDDSGQLPELADLLKKAGLHLHDVQMPRRIKYVEPQNPVQATATDFPSVVVLHCQLDVKGQVVSCDSKRAPSATFSDPAIDAVKQWQYTPFMLRGAPTSLWFTVVVNFTL